MLSIYMLKTMLSISIILFTVLHIEAFSSMSRISHLPLFFTRVSKVHNRYPVQLLSNKGDINEEVAKLRAAAQKAREEAQLLSNEMGKKESISTSVITGSQPTTIDRSSVSSTAATTTTTVQQQVSRPSSSQILTQLQSIIQPQVVVDDDDDKQGQSLQLNPLSFDQSLDQLRSSSSSSSSTLPMITLWKSAKTLTQQSFTVSLETLSSRTNGRVTPITLGVNSDGSMISTSGQQISLEDFQDSTIAVTVVSTVLAIASLILLPSNIGATFCYFIAFIPIAWIAVGSVAPFLLANLIGMTKKDNANNVFSSSSSSSSSSTSTLGTIPIVDSEEKRIYCHEAGHFLCGYLCGLPIQRYSIVPLNNNNKSTTTSSFFDNNSLKKNTKGPQVEFVYSLQNPSQLTSQEIATLSVVALSGSVAEIVSCGSAKGGAADLIELDLIFRKRSKEFIGAQKQEELTRWGALTAYQLLIKHKEVYEKLIIALEQGKSVLECIAMIEGE